MGIGVASYPTITTAQYREELTFQAHGDMSRWHYEQKTWHLVDGEEVILHWECGFIRQLDTGDYEWVNAQNNGRAEVMKGTIIENEGSITLTFTTANFMNDPRMREASRTLTVTGDSLHYEQKMATQTHIDIHAHLEANLTRT